MNKECSVYITADFIGKKWTLLILIELYKGQSKWKRYTNLKNKLMNITPKILSERLKELEKEGMIKKKVDSTKFPIKCEYSLTESGIDFIEILKDMKKWTLKWKTENKLCEKHDCLVCDL